MADLEFDEFEGDYGVPGYGHADGGLDRARRLVNITGAMCSVALVLGLGLWGYQLAVRDVAGVPVMRALTGPMRIAPADPGGDQASNQGLSVNAIAASGTAAPLSEQLTLAPRPIELQPDDGTGLQAPIPDTGDAQVVQASLQITSTAMPGSQTVTDAALDDGGGSLIDASTGQSVDPLNADPEVGSVAVSLRPKARPTAMGGKAASKPTQVQNVSAPAPAAEIDGATLQMGTRLAQLGAFDTPDLARSHFAELQTVFGELMAGKSIVIQTAQSGGRTFYRLRAHGFEGDDDARRFCAVLEADDVDCIPVAQR
jgi:hypothetical protein